MSCYHPLTIKNNSTYINDNAFRTVLQVPCGKCESCRRTKAFQLKTRCYYETLECRKAGGVGICDALTYAPEYLPTVDDIPVFCHDHLVLYKKRVRFYLSSRFPDLYHALPEGVPSCRFVIVSEFGGNYHRPHYHVILWCYLPISYMDLAIISHDAWTFGFTDTVTKEDVENAAKNGKRLSQRLCKQVFLNDPCRSAKYITDYVTVKGDEILKQKEYDYLQKVGKMPKNVCYAHYKEIAQSKVSSLRTWTSNGLGSFFLQTLVDDTAAAEVGLTSAKVRSMFENGHCIPIPNASGGYDFCPCGHYYGYKIFFDRVTNEKSGRNDRYILNDYGVACRLGNVQKQIDALSAVLSRAYGCLEPDVKPFVDNVLKTHTFGDLARYDVVLKNKIFVSGQYYSGFLSDTLSPVDAVVNPHKWNIENPLYAEDADLHTVFDRWCEMYERRIDRDLEFALQYLYSAFNEKVRDKEEKEYIDEQRLKYRMRKIHRDKQYIQLYSTH